MKLGFTCRKSMAVSQVKSTQSCISTMEPMDWSQTGSVKGELKTLVSFLVFFFGL